MLAAVAAGCGGGSEATTVTRTVTETVSETVTRTETEPAAVGLPEPVAETHRALLEAARARDYEALRPLVGDDLSYSFGGPVEGGAIAYWQGLEESGEADPLAVLEQILELPYALHGGNYVWPFAHGAQRPELTQHERRLLGDLADDYLDGVYLGWRAGIAPDGTWLFFIAGD